jgi:hypothetical protein
MRFKRTLVISGIVLIVLFLLAGFLLPLIPPKDERRVTVSFCEKCGAMRDAVEEGPVGGPLRVTSEKLGRYPLGEWSVKHFGDKCEHSWKRANVSVLKYVSLLGMFRWQQSAEFVDDHTPAILHPSSEDLKDLETRFAADPQACRTYVERRLHETLLPATPREGPKQK